MRRREFLGVLGCVAAACPVVARAQRPADATRRLPTRRTTTVQSHYGLARECATGPY